MNCYKYLPCFTLWIVCQSPKSGDASETVQLLIRFLVDVPNHIAAASKLLTDILVTDVFWVGVTTDNE